MLVRRLLAAGVLSIALIALWGASQAGASAPIEGVWSFNGGAIAVQAQPDGSFAGTVVSPTTFASCPHPIGEVVWTSMTAQPDGSFWGSHQWFQGSACQLDTQRGPAAWRVMTTASGARYLRVCLSNPGTGAPQPTIAPDGTAAGDTFGCLNSSLIEPVPVVAPTGTTGTTGDTGTSGDTGSTGATGPPTLSFAQLASMPSARRCVRGGVLRVELQSPAYDPLAGATATVDGRRVLAVHGVKRLGKGVTLHGLPHGRYTLRLVLTTVLRQRLAGSRRYHSCH